MAKNVLLGNMSCLPDFGDPNKRYQAFLQRGLPPFRTLIESILLFDKISIPTNDFMPLGLLIGVLGEAYVTKLLDEDIISFARFTGSVAYVGNGKGISVINLTDSDKTTPKLFSAPTNNAIDALLSGIPAKDPSLLKQLALRSTVEFSIEDSDGQLADTVYAEVKREPSIVKACGLVNLKHLAGINPDEVRGLGFLTSDDQDDDIFQILRVAQSVLEARAAQIALCNDIYTSEEVAKLFLNSVSRVSNQTHPGSELTALFSIAELPDIGLLALQKKEIIKDLISLRQSTTGIQFRTWFHEHCRTDPKSVSKEYCAILKSVPFIQSAMGRTMRYFAQTAAAIAAMPLDPTLGLGVGATLGALDSFVIDRLFKGSSPKVFMERLADISRKD